MDDKLTIEQWTFMDKSQKTHINRFVQAYRRGMERDPTNFKARHTKNEWEYEYGLFVDVDGDAEDPISNDGP